jgi:Xaa-Pro dipeptidase
MPMQTANAPVTDDMYRSRIGKVQEVMKEFGIQALVLEPGPTMLYLTGVRWGRSERTFAAVIPAKGDPSYVLPGFEEMRARELIRIGNDIRVWQEDESPYGEIAEILNGKARVGIDASVRFFVFDKVRTEAPKTDYVSAETVLKKAGVDLTPAARRR